MDRLEQQMEFILELDKLKEIKRQSLIANGLRHENDAEHSWHLALMCLLLDEYSNQPIDKLKVMAMVIIHDVVEIDAGDTYAYDDAGNATKEKREKAAADRIFALLPPDQAIYYRGLWDEFEEAKTNEAKFAMTLDKIQPILLNNATNGQMWKHHQVKEEQIMNRNSNTKDGSVALWQYAHTLIQDHIKKGNIKEV